MTGPPFWSLVRRSNQPRRRLRRTGRTGRRFKHTVLHSDICHLLPFKTSEIYGSKYLMFDGEGTWTHTSMGNGGIIVLNRRDYRTRDTLVVDIKHGEEGE